MAGRVLCLVPSISLFQQSMREWAEQRELAHRYIGICSDTRAGRTDEDASLLELELPVTTDPATIGKALRFASPKAMTVVFCTYHSLGLVERAQDKGAPPFDLILCDEAHRTTGIERPGDRTSPFVLVHDADAHPGRQAPLHDGDAAPLYRGGEDEGRIHGVEVFSMDDEATYGPEFHRLPFSRAVEQGLLSDYKVVVLALSESHVDRALQAHLASSGGHQSERRRPDRRAAGARCRTRRIRPPSDGARNRPLRRAIAFTNTDQVVSTLLAKHWGGIVERPRRCCRRRSAGAAFRVRDAARRRTASRARPQGADRVAEGHDRGCLPHPVQRPVPVGGHRRAGARRGDLHDRAQEHRRHRPGRGPRHAQGRRQDLRIHRAAGRGAGRADPALVLDTAARSSMSVWSVLRALRSHDDRLDAEINQIDLNDRPTDRIIFRRDGTTRTPCPMRPSLRSRRSTCRRAPSTRGSSRSAATGSTGRAGRRMSRTSSRAW